MNRKWTHDKCYEIAKRYEWFSEFMRYDKNAYRASNKYGYIREFTWLKRVVKVDGKVSYVLYLYCFRELNVAYVGITVNQTRREEEHRRSGVVYSFCKENGMEVPKPIVLYQDLTISEATNLEKEMIQKYKRLGYHVLNKRDGGQLGSMEWLNRTERRDNFILRAREIHGDKYDYSKVEYVNSKKLTTIVCQIHGGFEQSPSNHLQGRGCPKCYYGRVTKIKTKWTYKSCKEESEKYKSRDDFKKGSCGAYRTSRINGWLNDFYPKK